MEKVVNNSGRGNRNRYVKGQENENGKIRYGKSYEKFYISFIAAYTFVANP